MRFYRYAWRAVVATVALVVAVGYVRFVRAVHAHYAEEAAAHAARSKIFHTECPPGGWPFDCKSVEVPVPVDYFGEVFLPTFLWSAALLAAICAAVGYIVWLLRSIR